MIGTGSPPLPTRRSVLRGAGALGLGALLAGCAGGETGVAPAADARTITHKLGTTEISGTPQRVVTLGLTDQDYVLALGVVPVGVREWFGAQPGALWPWAASAAGGAVPAVLPVVQLDFEQIATLAPDLIVGVNSGLTPDEYRILSGIAPTVAQPVEFADYGVPWQTMTEIIGTALGHTGQVGAAVADVESRFTAARAANPGFAGRTALLAALLEDSTWYVYAEGPAPRVLVDLGFALPPAAAALFTGENRPPVLLSGEQLGVLDADVLLVGLYGPDAEATLAADPVVGGLPVARDGRIVAMPELSTLNGALSFGSLLSLPVALDELTPRLAAALA